MDKSEKISWFEQFKIACLKPSQYKRLLNLAKGKVILFLAAITLITTILGYGMDVAGFTVSVGGWKNFILNRLPAFELKDGTLSVDQEMDFEIGGVHFVAGLICRMHLEFPLWKALRLVRIRIPVVRLP